MEFSRVEKGSKMPRAEAALPLVGKRDVSSEGRTSSNQRALAGGVPEYAIADHWPSNCAPGLMLNIERVHGGGGSKVVLGVQIIVAQKPKSRAVVFVRAALSYDVHHCAGRRAVFGGEVARIDLELLDRFERRAHRVVDCRVPADS